METRNRNIKVLKEMFDLASDSLVFQMCGMLVFILYWFSLECLKQWTTDWFGPESRTTIYIITRAFSVFGPITPLGKLVLCVVPLHFAYTIATSDAWWTAAKAIYVVFPIFSAVLVAFLFVMIHVTGWYVKWFVADVERFTADAWRKVLVPVSGPAPIKEGNSSEFCPICRDDLDGSAPACLLPACHHEFHTECILDHLTGRFEESPPGCRRCPVCNDDACQVDPKLVSLHHYRYANGRTILPG